MLKIFTLFSSVLGIRLPYEKIIFQKKINKSQNIVFFIFQIFKSCFRASLVSEKENKPVETTKTSKKSDFIFFLILLCITKSSL